MKSETEKLLTGKYKKVAIIGFPKCGTTSLHKHLEKLGVTVQRPEIIYYLDTPQGFDYVKEHLKGYKLVTVWRNNAERLWSAWHFFGFNTRMSFERFIKGVGNDYHGVGCNGIGQCDYEYYEENWRQNGFKILSINLDDIKEFLPKENVSKAGQVPKEAIELVKKKFIEYQESDLVHPTYNSPKKKMKYSEEETKRRLNELFTLPKQKHELKGMSLEEMLDAVKTQSN